FAVPRSAPADAGPPMGWFAPVGVNVGGSLHHDVPGGFVLGGEASIVRFDGAWMGAYTDALWDFGADEFRFSVGPEIGIAFLGVDLGYLGTVSGDEYHHGVAVRGLLTLSLVGFYARWGHQFARDERSPDFGEVGALLKVPLPVALEGRHRNEAAPAV